MSEDTLTLTGVDGSDGGYSKRFLIPDEDDVTSMIAASYDLEDNKGSFMFTIFETEDGDRPVGTFECYLKENSIRILNKDYDKVESVMYTDDVAGRNPLSFHINPSKIQAYFCCEGKVLAKKFEHEMFGIKGFGCITTCIKREVSLTLL